MSAFLKIDQCRTCRRAIPWEWAPVVMAAGRALPGTGVWRSQLAEGLCPSCAAEFAAQLQKEQQALQRRAELVELLGGEKPCREFTFERFIVEPGNKRAYERCKAFNPAAENLYLWGACGVGKTHLAWAAARRCFEETLSVEILPAYKISRRVRMKEPHQEQAAIDDLNRADVLVIDDLGEGQNTSYSQQLLQEILDGRDYQDRAGLVVTSAYSLDELARKLGRDSIPSRLAGMCQVVSIGGHDRRLPRDALP
jgi:DNA replication protein DnaC